MKNLVTVLLSLISINSYAQKIEKEFLTIGEQISFFSEILNEERVLNVYLPLGYSEDSAKTYPVIYLLDGSMNEDMIHITGLNQFFSYPWINKMPECIVIGISNVDRKRDYTFPTTVKKDREAFPTAGGSEAFIRFIASELQPLINERYPTRSGPTLVGQSLGGLLATEILLKQPELFDKYLIVSPSLWWDNQSLLDLELKPEVNGKSIYVAVGKEGKVMETDAKNLYKKLTKKFPGNTRIHFRYFEEFEHGDILHMAAYRGFGKLFETDE